MKLLKKNTEKEKEIHAYFGYEEGWAVIPIDDQTDMFWGIDGSEEDGTVCYADTEDEFNSHDGNYYTSTIYTTIHLPKYVYKGKDFTMISVDTECDGNKFLMIFSNQKRCRYRANTCSF